MNKTDVIIVADLSGSMGHLAHKQRQLIEEMVAQLVKETTWEHSFDVTLIGFGSAVSAGLKKAAASHGAMDFYPLRYANQGSTRLMDAIGAALDRVDPTTPTLINVFTDGGENGSNLWNAPRITAALKNAEATGNLTLTVAGPPQALHQLSQCGIPQGNFKAWDGSAAEHVTVTNVSTASLSTYVAERKAGRRRSVSYFVDPSQLKTAGVRSMAKKVEPEEVKVVSKTMAGRAIADAFKKFEKGRHYYQLMKPESIDADKDLVVHIKDKGEYRLGSRTVRILLGLPEDGRIRVKPAKPVAGQDPNFEVFVQSSSVNRKLVEGQKLLTL
jgi:uncharacterized protein YegL